MGEAGLVDVFTVMRHQAEVGFRAVRMRAPGVWRHLPCDSWTDPGWLTDAAKSP